MNALRIIYPFAWGVGAILSLGLIVDSVDYPEPALRVAGGLLMFIFLVIGFEFLLRDIPPQ